MSCWLSMSSGPRRPRADSASAIPSFAGRSMTVRRRAGESEPTPGRRRRSHASHAPARVLAHHVENSRRVGDEAAIALLTQAGREAAPRAPETAGRWLLAATRLLGMDGDEHRRLSLLAEAATALIYAGAYDEALDALDEAGRRLPSPSGSATAPGWPPASRSPSA